ncbi:phosphatidylserine/phosphatidylglycerophosphate/cardiolipin synthase family protein [Bacteriovoracaceae bacterium]|nr:phosphatidylserine/phosphatidylglycerophosphate/cardiolipin synthase family protein [Bacteriovoracaceae bacterium]
MFHSKLFFTLIVSFSFLLSQVSAKEPYALFSPHEGKEAFNTMYDMIKNAREKAHVTIYSWSDRGITKAFEQALKNNVDVRIVLHKPLTEKPKVMKTVAELEKKGAMIKISHQNMHEKMVIVDDIKMVNSSANMSNGAKSKYSEDFTFVFVDNPEKEKDNVLILNQFIKEFKYLWNSAKDVKTPGELKSATPLEIKDLKNNPIKNAAAILYSSSHARTYKESGKNTKTYEKGMWIKSSLDRSAYVVSKALVKAIDKARTNVYFTLNHLFLDNVVQAAIRAMNRGVKVQWSLDNQEFKGLYGGRKAQILKFVKAYQKKFPNKEVPIRIKYYSHNPSPKFWFLNHHKYTLIDYKANDMSNTVLFAGSHNLSKTAETSQYDNLVRFEGKQFSRLYKEYFKQFENLWYMGRNKSIDKLKRGKLDPFMKVYSNKKVALHLTDKYDVISMTWQEVIDFRADLNKVAPGVFASSMKERDCFYYNFKAKKFEGCPSK